MLYCYVHAVAEVSFQVWMRGGSCAVVELQPAGDSSGRATLFSYMVGQHKLTKWVEKELASSLPPAPLRDWSGEGVVSHGGMLWWVDFSYSGVLACDPFGDEPELLHVPLSSLDGPLTGCEWIRRPTAVPAAA